MVVNDEVFEQVEENALVADTAQHGFEFDISLIFLLESFPLVEKLIFAAESSNLCLVAVTEH